MTDEEWYAVTRTWFVRAVDWYEASQVAKHARREDSLRVSRYGQVDPRQWMPQADPGDGRVPIDREAALSRLRQLWQTSGETTRSLAGKAGISHTTIATYVNGTCVNPQFRTLARIVRALGGEPKDYLDTS